MELDFRDRERLFLLGANALYLNRLNFLIQFNAAPPGCREYMSKSASGDFESFDYLRSRISCPGLMDDRIEDPYEWSGTFPQYNEPLKALIKSNADVARVSLKDLPFEKCEIDQLIFANGGKMDRSDWLMPICRWSPGPVIWTARYMVADFLSEDVTLDARDPARADDDAKEDEWETAVRDHVDWKRSAARNGPIIRDAVRRVMAGTEANAHAAALSLRASQSWAPKDKAKGGQIRAASEAAAKDVIYLPAKKILNYLAENGFHPK